MCPKKELLCGLWVESMVWDVGVSGLGGLVYCYKSVDRPEEALRLIDWVLKRMCGWICTAAVSAL